MSMLWQSQVDGEDSEVVLRTAECVAPERNCFAGIVGEAAGETVIGRREGRKNYDYLTIFRNLGFPNP